MAGPKEYSLHVVGLLLLQRSRNCTHSSCPPQWGPVSTVFWAGRPSGPAGWLAQLLLKAGDVETNPGPKHTRTQVWICDICHREITRKQIDGQKVGHFLITIQQFFKPIINQLWT